MGNFSPATANSPHFAALSFRAITLCRVYFFKNCGSYTKNTLQILSICQVSHPTLKICYLIVQSFVNKPDSSENTFCCRSSTQSD